MTVITFQCYACNQMLKVGADKGGKKTKCIKCGTILTIPVAAAEPEVLAPEVFVPEVLSPEVLAPELVRERIAKPPAARQPVQRNQFDFGAVETYQTRAGRDRFDDEDRWRRGDPDADRDRIRTRDRYDDIDRGPMDWSKVQLGMLLVFIGMCVFTVAYGIEHIFVLILTILTFGSGMNTSGEWMIIVLRIAVSLLMLGLVPILIGQVFWCFTRNRSGALVIGIFAGSVTCLCLVWVLIFKAIGIYDSLPDLPYGMLILLNFRNLAASRVGDLGHAVLHGMANVLVAITFLMMGIYIRAQGLSARDRSIASKGLLIVIFASIAAGYQLLWPFLMRAFAGSSFGTGAQVATWIIYWIGVGWNIVLLIYVLVSIRGAQHMIWRAQREQR